MAHTNSSPQGIEPFMLQKLLALAICKQTTMLLRPCTSCTPYPPMPQHAPPHYATHYTTPNHTALHHTAPHRTAPHHTTPHHTTPHHTTPHHTTPPQLNERLSLGQHRVWKRMAVRWSGAAPGHTALDVCCGSGDLAFELARAVGASGEVVGLDFAAEMLDDAEARRLGMEGQRLASRPMARMRWVQGDALDLPFPDCSFDAATMGYGLRNVADIPR